MIISGVIAVKGFSLAAVIVALVLLTVLCVAYLLDASFLPFAYLNF